MRSAMMRGPLSRMAEFLYLHMSAELNRRRDANRRRSRQVSRNTTFDALALRKLCSDLDGKNLDF